MTIYRKLRAFKYRDYTILGELGSGLAGKVYLAQHRSTGTIVALKVLHSSADSLVRDFFLNEQRLLRKADHPRIVRYVEGGSNAQEMFLVMQFAEGTPLNELMGRPMPTTAVVHLVKQIAEALDYLHQRHPDHPIVHCDVTPRNIVVAENGDAVLLDLSSARTSFFAPAEDATMLSPRYCAPEQLQHRALPASDQFALAVIAFELLLGTTAFPQEQKRSAQERSGNVVEHSVLTRMPEQYRATAQVLNTALQRLAELRYESCHVFAAQLDQALREDGLLVGDGRTMLLEHIRKQGRRRSYSGRWQYATVASLLLLAMLVLWLRSGQPLVVAAPDQSLTRLPAAASSTPVHISRFPIEQSTTVTKTLPTSTLVSMVVPIATATETSMPTGTPVPTVATVAKSNTTTNKPTKKPTPPRSSQAPTFPKMPELRGYGENQAKELLANLGVGMAHIQVQYQSRSELGALFDRYPAYAVVSTLPAVGNELRPGMLIILGVRSPQDDSPPPPPTALPIILPPVSQP